MRNSYEVRAQRFVKMLAPYLNGCVRCYDYEDALEAFLSDHPYRRIHFDHGMTRVAFITADYVVKIDYDEDEVKTFGGGEKEIAFYVVPDYAVKHRKQDLDLFYQEVCSRYPDMTIEMNLTIDM